MDYSHSHAPRSGNLGSRASLRVRGLVIAVPEQCHLMLLLNIDDIRIPLVPADTFETFRNGLPAYLREVRQANSEASKALTLLMLIRQTFENIDADKPSKLIPDLEHYVSVRAGTIMIRGRIDALLGNLVIELKMTLDEARLDEAKTQLRKYVAALWAIDRQRTNYMLMATDGLRFRVYKPTAPLMAQGASPDDVTLEEVNLMDVEAAAPEDAFRWLDRYVLWRERIPPTTEEMARDFGIDSPTFASAMEGLKKAWNRGRATASAPFAEWSKYLSVVYGEAVGDETLFVKHTYLATLAKLMVYTYYSSGAIPSKEVIRKVLSGEAFKEWGIENFLEEDFFSWLVRGDAQEDGVKLAWELLKVLERYDLSKLTEDVLKGLYQGLVDPEARHDLGEYYTPDWLAEWIVERLFEDPRVTALDPACGSGTFLAAAIRKKSTTLKMEPHLRLIHILASVKGIDVHPLAVLISKANYLMALGDMVKFKAGRIHVPVYLANSIDFPTAKRDVEHGVEVYRYPVSNHDSLVVPKESVDKGISGELVEAVTRFARMVADETVKQEPSLFDKFVAKEVGGYGNLAEGAKDALWSTCKTLTKLIKDNRDTIYAFIVKNVYRPATIGRFDVVMGNPPWLSYRYVKLPDYQRSLKTMILKEHRLLPPKRAEHLTNMELATLFFARSVKVYLRDGGKIGFVMPRAVFTADQHDSFRSGDFDPQVGFTEVADLEGVTPLFKVPAAVIIAEKGMKPCIPKTATKMCGTLPEKNANLATVKKLQSQGKLESVVADLRLVKLGERTAWAYGSEGPCGGKPLRPGPSLYEKVFRRGADLIPRPLWWVDIKVSPKFGVNPEEPLVETSERAVDRATEAYKNLRMSGNVERNYLYESLLASDVLPFVHLDFRCLVLPLEPAGNRYTLLTRNDVEARGNQGMSRWLRKAEKEWTTRRGKKADKVSLYDWIDWSSKLTQQNPRAKFRLVYNVSGTYLSSCVIDCHQGHSITVNHTEIPLRGFVSDTKVVYFETDDSQEAHYLAAIFNSRVLDTIIKPMQSRGLWGPRDIHKKPLEIGIPRFDPKSKAHVELASLAETCAVTARKVMDEFVEKKGGKVDNLSPQVVGQLRSKIRDALAVELDRIDELVCEILTEQ